MAEGTREISLKGPNGVWGGITDASSMSPGLGTFSSLENAYLSRDGTEIRRWMGSKVLGFPFLGLDVPIWGVEPDGGGAGVDYVETQFPHYLPTGTSKVFIFGSSVISLNVYTVTRVNEYKFSIGNVASALEFSGSGTGRVWLQRVGQPHALTHADGRPVIVAETDSASSQGTGSKAHICTWVASRVMDPNSALIPGYAGLGGGTEVTSVDSGFIAWPVPHMELVSADRIAASGGGAVNETAVDGQIFGMNILNRCVVDVLNRRVLIAVPGHGCMFEANVDRERNPLLSDGTTTYNGGAQPIPDHRKTKTLGIPKGAIEATTWDGNGGSGYSDSVFASGDQVYIAVGFMDVSTGEVGLPSEVIQTAAASTDQSYLRVSCRAPRSIMREVSGLATILYMSEIGAAAPAALFPVAYVYYPFEISERAIKFESPAAKAFIFEDGQAFVYRGKFSGAWGGALSRTIQAPLPESAVYPERFPVLEQMPTGASWVKVARGRMLAGNDRPDNVSVTARTYEDTVENAASSGAPVEADFLHFESSLQGGTETKPTEPKWDAHLMSPAYVGHQFSIAWGDDSKQTGIGADFVIGTIEEMHNHDGTFDGNRYQTDADFIDPADSAPSEDSEIVKIIMQPENVMFSEEGFPGVVTSNRLPVDVTIGRRPVAAGRLGDTVIIFTDRTSHLFNWGLLPRRATSTVISNEFGCIAPASVVEAAGMLVWCSADGPMAYSHGGGLRWISRGIQELWDTFLSQTDGMRGEIQGCHDSKRGLVIWQMTTSYDDTTDDASKSKTSCDRLLVWNYQANAWSIVKQNASNRTHCINTLPINDSSSNKSLWAPCYISTTTDSDYYPLYMWDERYANRVDNAVPYSATSDWSGTTTFTSTSIPPINPGFGDGEGDNAFIYSPMNKQLLWWGDITSTQAGSATLSSVSGTVGWKTGDVLETRVITMSMSTNLYHMGDLSAPNTIRGVVVRLVQYQNPASSAGKRSWLRVRIEDEDGTIVNLCQNKQGDYVQDGTNKFNHGVMRCEQFKVHIDVISNVQVRIKDIAIEVDAST